MRKILLLCTCFCFIMTANDIWAQSNPPAAAPVAPPQDAIQQNIHRQNASQRGVPCGQMSLPPNGAVNARQGTELMQACGGNLYILDVRSPEEYAQGHVGGAHLIPLPDLEKNSGSIPADSPVLIVCRTGRRAKAAFETLAAVRRADVPLWYLHAKPRYNADGTFVFED